MKPKKDTNMKIRSQHNFTISVPDMTKLISPRVIKLIGDEGLSEDLVNISWNKKTQKFQVSVDVTWEPDLNDLEDNDDDEENGVIWQGRAKEENEIAQILSEYQFSYELKKGSHFTNSIWKKMKAEKPYAGEEIFLIKRNGLIIKAEVSEVTPYGDLWVFLDGKEFIVTNHDDDCAYLESINEIKMIYWG